MSALTIRLIEAQAGKLKNESRRLRHYADVCPNETRAMVMRRHAWRLTGASRKMLEAIGSL